jgi:hypothetical protein
MEVIYSFESTTVIIVLMAVFYYIDHCKRLEARCKLLEVRCKWLEAGLQEFLG